MTNIDSKLQIHDIDCNQFSTLRTEGEDKYKGLI